MASFHGQSSPGSNPRSAPSRISQGVLSSSFLSSLLAASSPRFESPFHPSRTSQDVLSSSPCFLKTFSGHPGSNLRPLGRSVLVAASFVMQRPSLSSQDGNLFGGTGWESNPRDTCLAKVPAHVRSSALAPSTTPAPLLSPSFFVGSFFVLYARQSFFLVYPCQAKCMALDFWRG